MKISLYLVLILGILFPSISSASFDTSLKYGSRGDAVAELQDFLQDQGQYTGKVDGKFGLGTLKAVKAWQSSNELAIDGYFGKGSRAKANEILLVLLKDSNTTEIAEEGTIVPPLVQARSPQTVTDPTTQAKLDVLTNQVNTLNTALNAIAQNTAPIVKAPAPVIDNTPKEVTQEQIKSGIVYQRYGNSLWITTDGAQNGDVVTLTFGDVAQTKIAFNISGKNSIWEGWTLNTIDFSKPHTILIKIERGNIYSVQELKL